VSLDTSKSSGVKGRSSLLRSLEPESAGLYVLVHCDVLLAVWDGRGAQGRGGTGGIVAEARRRGLPLAWVHAGNRVLGTARPTSLGAEQGRVSFERFRDGVPT
jgi:hypothetical protein